MNVLTAMSLFLKRGMSHIVICDEFGMIFALTRYHQVTKVRGKMHTTVG